MSTAAPVSSAPRAARLRRRGLLGAGAALLLGACSRSQPEAAPAAAAPDAASSRAAFDTASRGSGFAVGQAMAARELRVFFDPQCPHCAALWAASRPLRDRIRMVWMPVAFIAPVSAPQGAMLLSAADPVRAMDQHESLLAGGKGGLVVIGPSQDALLAKIKANTALWQGLNASSVPYLVYRAGNEGPFGTLAGGLPTAELEQLLQL